MTRAVFRRTEFQHAALDFGTLQIDLADYATTGLRAVTVGPSGIGKTNSGLVIAEQLAAQGWVCVLMDPEGEIASLYPEGVVESPEDLAAALEARDRTTLVVPVENAKGFIPMGRAVLEAADAYRKPIFLMIDEGQVFSSAKKRKEATGEASDLVNDMVERGRKRSLDLFLSAHRFSGSLHRSVFTNKNLCLVGQQQDPTAWAALAPQFRGSRIGFADLAALAPGEFFCFSRRGVEKVVMRLAQALADVAPAATRVRPSIPQTFAQWDIAVAEIPTARLQALTPDLTAFLGVVAGLTPAQQAAGHRALRDELVARGVSA